MTPNQETFKLKQVAILNKPNEKLERLASIIEKGENWGGSTAPSYGIKEDYYVLWNYLYHTFERIYTTEREKFVENHDNSLACFNTGLISNNKEDIIALLKKHSPSNLKYNVVGFFPESHRSLDEIKMFSVLPEPAYYIDDPADFIFDYRKAKNLSYRNKHILGDRLERWLNILPPSMIHLPIDIIEQWIRGLIPESVRRLRQNYKLAVPQYYKGEVQLLIPVCTRIDIDKYRATCALPVRRVGESYIAETILTLEMAYNNARLIAKPDPEWIKPTTGNQP